MSSSATHFKFTCYPHTRRATFQSRPTWLALSDKIHSLFDIPLDKVAVSYIDVEDDEVTLSTQEELEDFYQDLDTGGGWRPGDVVKLTVLDLSSARQDKSEKSLPTTPRSTNPRNTFGANLSDGLPFNIDEDWQNFPPFAGVYVGNPPAQKQDGSVHAFIEVLESDAEVSAQKSPPSSGTSSVRTPTPRPDKGKGRAFDVEEGENLDVPVAEDDDVSSIASVIDSQGSEKKPDIHVMGRQASSGLFEPVESRASYQSRTSHGSRTSRRSSIAVAPIGDESTPKSSAKYFPTRSTSNVSIAPSSVLVPPTAGSTVVTEDPPLPPLDKTSLESGFENPSLSSDIASLLTTLTEVIASHPELSEGVRKILQNAVAGTYWTPGQRESIHEAAGSVADGLTSLDEEAGRKVAEALGNLFRAVGQVVGTSPSTNFKPNTSTSEPVNTTNASAPKNAGVNSSETHAPHRLPSFDSWNRGSYGYGCGYGSYGPPPPGPPPLPGGYVPKHLPLRGLYPSRVPEGPPMHHPANLARPSRPVRRPSRQSKDLRAQVEAAKLLYKAEKERYRADREERRNEKAERDRRLIEMFANRGDSLRENEHTPLAGTTTLNASPFPTPPPQEPASVTTAPPPHSQADTSQLISNGYGGYPSFEITRVPSAPHPTQNLRRVAETVGRRVSEQTSDPKERSLKRIIKKLGDMGFTTRANPDLTLRVTALLPSDITTMTADKEEDIATTLVNELLKSPRIPPTASGSGDVR
ncbi:hypothetical protein E1B28_012716 [Marasmius oreades]|uniref:PB1 domain-containing protein n=1 Tax=Marasmius oreades TaxID=181124 RepID=A0A9P7RSS8_9AGAR|nr:uncharacterized protein E1B28_012716 [Marasmius oreades]KAG7088748.1 hypothetical protein E1B28_012716 [Marasmius oreades]